MLLTILPNGDELHLGTPGDEFRIAEYLHANPPPNHPNPVFSLLRHGVASALNNRTTFGNAFYFIQVRNRIVSLLITCVHFDEFGGGYYLEILYGHTVEKYRRSGRIITLLGQIFRFEGCHKANVLLNRPSQEALIALPRLGFDEVAYDLFTMNFPAAYCCHRSMDMEYKHKSGEMRDLRVTHATPVFRDALAAHSVCISKLVLKRQLSFLDICDLWTATGIAVRIDNNIDRTPLVGRFYVLTCGDTAAGSIKVFFEWDVYRNGWIVYFRRPYIGRAWRNHSMLGARFIWRVMTQVCPTNTLEVRTYLQRGTDPNVLDARGFLESVGFRQLNNALLGSSYLGKRVASA